MKCIKIIFIVLSLINIKNEISAQIWKAPKIEIGASNRGTAYTADGREKRIFYNDVFTNSRISYVGIPESPSNWFFIDFTQKLPGNNKVSISLSNYFSIEKHYAIRKVVFNPTEAYSLRTKRDHFVNLFYSFGKEKQNLKPFLGVGFGIMNCGTKFEILPSGPLASISSSVIGTDRSATYRLHGGLQLSSLKASVIANVIGKENLGLPKINVEARLSYTISPFEKGSKILDIPKIKIFDTRLSILNMGIALRTKGIHLEAPRRFPLPSNGKLFPLQDATPRLFVDIKKKFKGKNNLFLNFSNYITYVNIGGANKINKFKRDHFVDVENHFKTKNEQAKFILGVGAGLMNCGTNYSYIRTYTDTLGQVNVVNTNAKSSQRFGTLRLILGLQKNAYTASIIAHASPDNDLKEGGPAIWLEAKLGHTLSLKKRKT